MAHSDAPPLARLYEVNAAAAKFYAARLSTSKKATAYLDSHGITSAAVREGPWQIGYAPGRWTELADHLRREGFTASEITAAGLGFIHRTSKHLLDRFRDRIMFPVTDHRNRVVAFTARDLSGRAEARWMNTPETSIYRKSALLYGLGQQLVHRPAGGGDPVVFLAEGAADVLALCVMAGAHAIFPETRPTYAVAPCGTNLTAEQLDLLHHAIPGAHLVLTFDGDEAGRRALSRAYPIAKNWQGELSGVRLPADQDPAELLASNGPTLAISEIVSLMRPLAELQMINVIEDLFSRGQITNPDKYVGDRLVAYHAISDLFVDAPKACRPMAETAAAMLSIDATDVVNGVIQTWPTSDPDPPAEVRPPQAADVPPGVPSSSTAGRSDAARDTRRPDEKTATVSAWARTTDRHTADTVSVVSRHDEVTGVAVWAFADGIGQHREAVAAAAVATDVAATVALRTAAAAGVNAARAAINAVYEGVHHSQAGDASLIVVSAYPSTRTRHGVRFELAWAGDCRAYTILGGQLAQVTADHTMARQRRDNGRPVQDGTITTALLTSSVRAGDISVCPLDHGPLLICNNVVHQGIPPNLLALELAGMSDAQASADRLAAATGAQVAGSAAVLLIHATSAPPSRIASVGPTRRPTPTATGSSAALAKTSFASPPTEIPQVSARINEPTGQTIRPAIRSHR